MPSWQQRSRQSDASSLVWWSRNGMNKSVSLVMHFDRMLTYRQRSEVKESLVSPEGYGCRGYWAMLPLPPVLEWGAQCYLTETRPHNNVLVIDRFHKSSAILCSRADSLHSCRVWFWTSGGSFLWPVFYGPNNAVSTLLRWLFIHWAIHPLGYSSIGLFIHWAIHPSMQRTCSIIWLLHGWCHVKLQPCRHTFCVPHTITHHGWVSLM